MRSVPSKMHIGRSSEPTATTNTPLRSAANSRPTVVDVIRAFVDELVASGRSEGEARDANSAIEHVATVDPDGDTIGEILTRRQGP
jgi:hypothetical protein